MFSTSLRDSQGTEVKPVAPECFDRAAYADYANRLEGRVRRFAEADSGVLVYRRFRVPEVFGDGCRDRQNSLSLQLGSLQASMCYAADIPNFLEPWYGLGTVAAAFGADYAWHAGQAPAVSPLFQDVATALAFEPKPIAQTQIGRDTLSYVEYFLEQTKGQLPMSFSDVQSPLNVISQLIPATSLFVDMLEEPQAYASLAETVADLTAVFYEQERNLIGDALVFPGHGFASGRSLRGLGASDDTSIMIGNDLFEDLEIPALVRACQAFGGTAYHSCGNWHGKIPSVLKIPNLVSADGAFTSQTDPSPNAPEDFAEAFAGSGVILNARMVGNADTVADAVQKLWRPGMKLIVCTYCESAEEQKTVYRRIHSICKL